MSLDRVLIKMVDGEKIYLDNASDYSVNGEKRIASVTIDGNRQFFNLNFVKYIGKADVLEQDDGE